MRRRDFLHAFGAGVTALTLPRLASAAVPDYQNLLILIELKGGNDGLNTVIPFEDPAYARLRPRLAIERHQILQLGPGTGLHPQLTRLLPAWNAHELAIVQGIGYPDPNQSHFRSIEIWDTASASDEYLERGWLTRVFAARPAPPVFAADGVVLGATDMGPLAGQGARAIALSSTENFRRQARLVNPNADSRNAALNHIVGVERDIVQAAHRLKPGRLFRTVFPRGRFGNQVRTAAELVASPAGVAVLRLALNGFDTHANQLPVHANLLRELAEGLEALRAALIEMQRWDSTLIMTYAEFGRRPRENQSGGTDHGTANAHFLLGGKVRGGLYGQPPRLTALDGNGNLPFAVDFRGLYATVIERWWGGDSHKVLGERHPLLDLIRT